MFSLALIANFFFSFIAALKPPSSSNNNIMQVNFYLIRHAETVANRQKILQGHVDYPLTTEGEENSLLLGNLLKTKQWTRLYCSDLGRAMRTLDLALSQFDSSYSLPAVKTTSLVREVSYGIFESLPILLGLDEVKELRAKERGVTVDEIIDDRESKESVLARQQSFLTMMMTELDHSLSAEEAATTTREINVLCVSHGGYIKRFLRKHCGIDLTDKIENCSTSVIRITKSIETNQIVCVASKDEVNLLNDSTFLP